MDIDKLVEGQEYIIKTAEEILNNSDANKDGVTYRRFDGGIKRYSDTSDCNVLKCMLNRSGERIKAVDIRVNWFLDHSGSWHLWMLKPVEQELIW